MYMTDGGVQKSFCLIFNKMKMFGLKFRGLPFAGTCVGGDRTTHINTLL